MRIAEIHSSELTSDCLRKVYHRLRGETSGEATTALYRGLVAGRACELMHNMGFDEDISNLTVMAASDTQKQLASENRILTESVEHNLQDILAEVTLVIGLYRDRFRHLFEQCELMGTEIPARYNMLGTEFASHLDLAVRDTKGVFGFGVNRILVFDWKWRQEMPSHQYLARYMQFALYYLMVKEGSLMCGPKGFEWMDYKESPILVWLHLPALKPYTRKTVSRDDKGEQKEFVKGDFKPMRAVLRRVEYDKNRDDSIKQELALRANMIEKDVFPLNPSPVSCRICDAEAFCSRFDTAKLDE